jgi:hypothetical protein
MTRILFNPRGVFQREELPLAVRPHSLDHAVLGIIDNGKENAGLFLDDIQSKIQTAYPVSEVLRIRKAIAGTPAPFTRDFFERCGVAVNAFGD